MAGFEQTVKTEKLLPEPATYSLRQASKVGGWGYTWSREAIQAGTFPVPVIRVGRNYRVPKRPLHLLLGIEDVPTGQ